MCPIRARCVPLIGTECSDVAGAFVPIAPNKCADDDAAAAAHPATWYLEEVVMMMGWG